MPTAYQLRIELCHLKPAIYRDVLVDPATTLPKLHKLIQAVMGWQDAHMHGFALPLRNEGYYAVPGSRRYEKPDIDSWDDPTNNETRYKVRDLLKAPKDKLLYLYDYGDDWEHTITLKAVVETDAPLPHLLKAQNGCPPDDCGGPSGAQYWASVWHDATHEDHAMALEILGDKEPGYLDLAALQKAVKKLQPKARKSQ